MFIYLLDHLFQFFKGKLNISINFSISLNNFPLMNGQLLQELNINPSHCFVNLIIHNLWSWSIKVQHSFADCLIELLRRPVLDMDPILGRWNKVEFIICNTSRSICASAHIHIYTYTHTHMYTQQLNNTTFYTG